MKCNNNGAACHKTKPMFETYKVVYPPHGLISLGQVVIWSLICYYRQVVLNSVICIIDDSMTEMKLPNGLWLIRKNWNGVSPSTNIKAFR